MKRDNKAEMLWLLLEEIRIASYLTPCTNGTGEAGINKEDAQVFWIDTGTSSEGKAKFFCCHSKS